jgi:hypothetical protein
MKFFEQEITELTDSNIPLDWNKWVSGNTYTYEDDNSLTNASVVTHNNYYWRSATINNTEEPSESSLKWAYLNGTKEESVSNKLALLDNKTTTITKIENDDLIVEFERKTINTLVIGNFSASKVKIEQLDENKVVLEGYTQEFNYYPVFGVYDAWTYGTAPFVFETNSNELVELKGIGKYVRVTFYQNIYNETSVGYLFGGSPIYTGDTVDEVQIDFDSYKTQQNGDIETFAPKQTMSFQTQAPREFTDQIRQIVSTLRSGAVRIFIIDDTDSTLYKNLIILGELQSAPITIDSFDEHITSWTVFENP